MSLLANELMKLFKRASTYIMLGILALGIIVTGGLMKYSEGAVQSEPNENWKQELVDDNKQLEQIYKDDRSVYRESYKINLEKNEYRIKHDIQPSTSLTVWSFMGGMSDIIQFISIITITVAAGIVAKEFSTGTIKLLLIRPASRVKILLSKYVSVLSFSVFVVLFAFTLAFIVGAVLFGFGDTGPYLAYRGGEVVEVSQIGNMFFTYLLSSVNLLMLTTMAFMISAAFRNSSLAIGLSIFLLLMGPSITQMIAIKYEWAKYILFANVDLLSYFNGYTMVEGMTLSFSIVMLVVYFIIFQAIAFFVFTKRDVAA